VVGVGFFLRHCEVQVYEVGNPLVHFLQLPAEHLAVTLLEIVARPIAGPLHQLSHLGQSHIQGTGPADQFHPADVNIRVKPISGITTDGGWKDADFFIVADGLARNTREFR